MATPNTSAHVSGDAVDIGPFDATAWLSEHGAEYGLCQIYSNEPWHYELRPEAIDHGCPPMYADPCTIQGCSSELVQIRADDAVQLGEVESSTTPPERGTRVLTASPRRSRGRRPGVRTCSASPCNMSSTVATEG